MPDPGTGNSGQQPGYGTPDGPGEHPRGTAGGTKAPPWYARWYVWVAVATVIVGAGAIAAGVAFGIAQFTGDDEDRPPASQPTATAPADEPSEEPTSAPPDDATDESPGGSPQEMSLGDSAVLDDNWEVVVHDPTMDATRDLVDAGNVEPPEGTVYATITVTATNIGSEPEKVYDGIVMAYVDANGEQYDSSAAVALDDAYKIAATPPGESDTGSYVFEVPAGSAGGYWMIQARYSDTAPVIAYVNE